MFSKATSVQDLVKNFPLIYVYEDAMRDKDLVGHVFHNSDFKSSSVLLVVYTRLPMFIFQPQGKELNDTAIYYKVNKGSHFTHNISNVLMDAMQPA